MTSRDATLSLARGFFLRTRTHLLAGLRYDANSGITLFNMYYLACEFEPFFGGFSLYLACRAPATLAVTMFSVCELYTNTIMKGGGNHECSKLWMPMK